MPFTASKIVAPRTHKSLFPSFLPDYTRLGLLDGRLLNAIAQPAVNREFRRPNKRIAGVAFASQVGLLAGAALWRFSADIIGRKLAFNSSLFICAEFVLIAGGMPNCISFAVMVAIYSAGAGGNYVPDAANFLEFSPVAHIWLVTFMSISWAVGYTVTGLLAWAYMNNFSYPNK